MNRRNIITLALCLTAVLSVSSEKAKQSSANPRTESKVSQSRSNGKYKRTTETFTGDILVARKDEVSIKDNGTIDYVFLKLFRDGTMTYASTFNKAARNTIRSYYHQGKMVVEEGDQDGDGFFETLILFDAAEQPVEAFSRSKDGTVAEFSKEELSKLKQSFAKLQE